MINSLSLTNFKCFENKTSFSFSKINLLTGVNGRGKSSVLQSLLLLSQTLRTIGSPQKLLINGEWVELGTFEDIKCSFSSNNNITFELETNLDEFKHLLFVYEEYHNNRIANLIELQINGENKFQEKTTENEQESSKSIKSLLPLGSLNTSSFLHNFHYISADRLGPKEYVKKSNLPESLKLGIRGENFTNILANYGKEKSIHNILCLDPSKISLIEQTTLWLSFIFDGANIGISGTDKSSSVLSVLLNSRNDDKNTTYKATNVGFGYYYILPIIVAGLIANEGDTLFIENPEAHLHPRAQSRMAHFLSKVASCGIQVFIESHSEHILNGMRLASLNSTIQLNSADFSIYYFDENYNCESIEIKDNGKISNWPYGFFDQQEIDLAEIFKLSR